MFQKVAFKLFGGIVSPYIDYFESLKTNLKKADIDIPIQEYIPMIIFYAMRVFVVPLIFFTDILPFIVLDFAYSYTLGIIISFITTGLALFMGYYYPSLQAKGIKSEIDRSLPFAVSYMATSASSGIHPIEIFKILALRGGRIGKEVLLRRDLWGHIFILGVSFPCVLVRKPRLRIALTPFRCSHLIAEEMGLAHADAPRL